MGEAVVKVSVNFTEEEKAYIMAIEDVVLRILDDREFAKDFAKDPDAILGKYGCGLDVKKQMSFMPSSLPLVTKM